MSQPDHLVALRAFAEILERRRVAYHVGGSVASSAWGRGRSTADVDLVAELDHGEVAPLVEMAAEQFYIDGAMIHEAIRRRRSFNVVHLETMIKVDVFIRNDTRYDEAAFSRTKRRPLSAGPGARPYPIACAEDIVLRKLAWYRAGSEVSERQWADVVDVLRVQRARLDETWMRRWAQELAVEDLLERALREAAPGRG